MDRNDFSFFDRNQPFTIFESNLPHWMQSGCLYFVTWRLGDSLPVEALVLLDDEINRKLISLGLDPCKDLSVQLQ